MPTPYGQDNDPEETARSHEDSEPMFNLPPLLKWMCLVLVIIHIGFEYLPANYLGPIAIKLAFIPARFTTADLIWHDPLASLISPIGHILLHANWMHLFSNLGMFLAFGTALHRLIGTERFILIIIIGAIAGSVSVTAMAPYSLTPMIGASDAISAVLGALIYFSWILAKAGISASMPFASKGRILTFVAIWVGMNFLFILAPTESIGGRIAWEAHLAGFVSGIIAAFCIFKLRRQD